MRAVAAIDAGRFENEIVPVETGAAGAAVLFAVDETPRRDTSLEKLATLAPAFKPDGVVTAGNSSMIVDGAAAMLLASEEACTRHGFEPRARFVSFGIAGVDPYRSLHGNPQAARKALAKAGLSYDDIAVVEVNEAFASVVAQYLRDEGLQERWDAGDVNPNGGGISLGHPLGATGARITATLLNELERRNARYGLATMCIGQGQAIAAVIERL
jgi:acetyl-CoA acetyltransferase family protein